MSIGPSRPLVLEKPAKIDIPQAARYFGARGEPDTATRTLLEKCAVPILAAATPRAVWLEADVDSLLEAGILQGGDVMKHLEGCPQALMLAVTLGPGVDAQIRRAGVGDIAASVASDALGSALAEQAADYEGVINVKNGVILEDGTTLTAAQAVAWVTGASAAAEMNQSLTNTAYDGAVDAATKYTKSQYEAAVKAGEFVFYGENPRPDRYQQPDHLHERENVRFHVKPSHSGAG